MKELSVSTGNSTGRQVTRSVPFALAPVIEALEFEEAFLVTTDRLDELRLEAGIKSSTAMVAKRLRDRGWLLETPQRGVWEFAPGSHAGPISRGQPFTDVLAVLEANPELQAGISLSSALWAHGLLDRSPDKPEVAIPVGREAPAPLKRAARTVNFDWVLPLVTKKGAPVHALETILVHLAARPTAVRSWSAVLEALPDVVAEVAHADVRKEVSGRPAAVATRLAYLVHGLSPDLAVAVKPQDHGKVWFGPRGPLKRHNSEFNIADTVLPVNPAILNDQWAA